MKKIFNFLIAMLAVCGVACDQLGGLLNGGISNGGNEDNGGNGNGNGNSGTTTSFVIDVTNITATGATVSVTPSTNETYYFDVIEKAYFDTYATEEEFAADYVADIQATINEINSSNGANYTLAEFLSSGSDSYTYEEGDLEPNTDYYAFAFCLSANGEIKGGFTKKAFKTLNEATTSENTFQVEVSNISATGVTVSVTPSNYDTYYFDVIEKDIYDAYTDKKAFAAEYIAEVKDFYESYGYTLADALSSDRDTHTYEDSFDANTDYYAFAVGVSSSGAITTDITVKAFTTLASGSGNEGGNTPGTGDLALNNFTYGYYSNYGDYYGTGATNWYIGLYPEEGMDFVTLEVQTALDATDFTGNYTLASTFEAGTAVAGFVEVDDEGGYVCGSYWGVLYSNYELADYALLASGSVTIGKTGSNYTIAVDAVDIDGYKVTVNYEGVLREYIDDGASLLSVRKKPARRLRFVPKTKSENGALSYRALTKVAESKDSIIKRKLMK